MRNTMPTLLIVDAQSVKNTNTAGSKGYSHFWGCCSEDRKHVLTKVALQS
ncbi:hypothetical protein NTGHW29_590008 [Candidatus Nitrotoga sp. HW29]|nr:hypothetical protein NTGHW29_590008 [Candidatus Nitrotoga sp. HW29]